MSFGLNQGMYMLPIASGFLGLSASGVGMPFNGQAVERYYGFSCVSVYWAWGQPGIALVAGASTNV
jgi:hypothetical protein